MLRAIAEMVAAVDVPVTADILAGIGDSVDAVVATVKEVIALGAAGVNIEDSTEVGGAHLLDLEYQAEKIRAVCAAVEASGVPIVVNARTDAYWLKLGDEKERLRTSIERANRYRAAGAHCLFVPGDRRRATLKTLVAEIAGPLNVLGDAGLPARRRAAIARRSPPERRLGADAREPDAGAPDRARPDRHRHLRAIPRRRDPVRRSERALCRRDESGSP